MLITRKRRHQHNQCGFRRWKLVTSASITRVLITRVDENLRIVEERRDQRVFRRLRRALQRTYRGGAHRDHAVAARFRRQHRIDHLLRHFGIFGCMVCSSMLSTRTGWKVPAPTCRVTNAISTPLARSLSSSGSSKCKPAVGAATAPGPCHRRFDRARGRRLRPGGQYRAAAAYGRSVRISSTGRSSLNSTSNSAPWRASIVALMLSSSPSSSSAPGFGAFEARIWARCAYHPASAPPALQSCRRWPCGRTDAPGSPGVVKHQQIAGIELIEDVGEGAMRQRARRPVQWRASDSYCAQASDSGRSEIRVVQKQNR